MVERGEPLTAEIMSSLYSDINERYYGKDIEKDDIIGNEWARIPHFYTPFYVYKYATGFSCASFIVKNIDKAKVAYRRFLTRGRSDYPISLLEEAGIDFNEVVTECLSEFEKAVEELEKLYGG